MKDAVIINWQGQTIPQMQVKLNLERDWMEDGACFEAPPEVRDLFFGFGRGPEFEEACALCAICPVKSLCYAYALIYGERGVWGGTHQSERDERRPFVVEDVVELWPRLYRKWLGRHERELAEVAAAQEVDVAGPLEPNLGSEDHARARARASEGMNPAWVHGRRNPRKAAELRNAE